MKNNWFLDAPWARGLKRIESGFTVGAETVAAGRFTRIVNRAPHALIVDMGIQRSKPRGPVGFRKLPGGGKSVPGTGGTKHSRSVPSKRIGSPQAPRGVGRPTLSHLDAQQEAMIARAVRRTEEKAPR